MTRTLANLVLAATMVAVVMASAAIAEDKLSVTTGVDIYNRYVWRGLDFANAPSLQPSLAVSFGSLELGAWGAYTLSNEASDSDEIDFWLSYARSLENGVSFSLIATDYYFPNAGIDFFNFNNYDAVRNDSIPDPGAHTVELGLSVTGPESFPMTISGYFNVHNDAGSNTYFQVDWPVKTDGIDLTFFLGAAGGSEDNPGYYGVDEIGVINLGINAAREINISESFSIPLNVSFIVNPEAEISYLLAGMSF